MSSRSASDQLRISVYKMLLISHDCSARMLSFPSLGSLCAILFTPLTPERKSSVSSIAFRLA